MHIFGRKIILLWLRWEVQKYNNFQHNHMYVLNYLPQNGFNFRIIFVTNKTNQWHKTTFCDHHLFLSISQAHFNSFLNHLDWMIPKVYLLMPNCLPNCENIRKDYKNKTQTQNISAKALYFDEGQHCFGKIIFFSKIY